MKGVKANMCTECVRKRKNIFSVVESVFVINTVVSLNMGRFNAASVYDEHY